MKLVAFLIIAGLAAVAVTPALANCPRSRGQPLVERRPLECLRAHREAHKQKRHCPRDMLASCQRC